MRIKASTATALYGEGSVRHRRMYTYSNPLNYKLSFFYLRHILIVKQHELASLAARRVPCTDLIIRDDKYQNSFHYIVIEGTSEGRGPFPLEKLPVRQDIFKACKERKPKERTVAMPHLPK